MAEQNRKAIEEKYVMLQLIDAQIKEFENELGALEQRSQELVKLKSSLDSLAKTNPGAATFASVGLGTFALSELKDPKHVLVNVGSGVLIKKDMESAKELITLQLHELDKAAAHLSQNMHTLIIRAQQAETEIQELLK
jgi:prefoldin alpha subunit